MADGVAVAVADQEQHAVGDVQQAGAQPAAVPSIDTGKRVGKANCAVAPPAGQVAISRSSSACSSHTGSSAPPATAAAIERACSCDESPST